MTQKKEKIAQLAKDLALSGKDILDVLKECGIDKKTGSSVEGAELELLFDRLTEAYQLENLDEYVNGTAKIIMPAPKVEKKPEPPKAEAKKAEVPKPAAPKAEAKAAPAPQA